MRNGFGSGRLFRRDAEGIGVRAMVRSAGRKTVSVSRGLMMLCETCHSQVLQEKLVDHRNFVADHETLFDTICPGCLDINRPLIDDMLGSSE